MHELFISYCRHDSDAANALADTLSKAGLSVWLDRRAIQEGDAFDTQIEEAIAQTRVVIVIWSEHSVKSHWVRAEAAYALGKHKLLPISIDQSEPPLQFMQIQTIDFRYWDRTSNHRAFQQLAGALAKRLEASATDAQPRSVSHTLAALSADAVEHPAKTRLEAWIVAAGLCFPETVVEKEYQDYFREKTFIIAQFAMLLTAATYVVYGAADMAIAMLMLGFLALLPLSAGSTIVLGSIVVAVHASVVMQAGMLLWTSWLFYLHVSSMFTVACCIAYWRERFYRTAFAVEFG
jgi:hypothetical protein